MHYSISIKEHVLQFYFEHSIRTPKRTLSELITLELSVLSLDEIMLKSHSEAQTGVICLVTSLLTYCWTMPKVKYAATF